ncbi:MAG: hypothetical protein ACKPKO_27365, partial [Candidatus Fonsibacter sp.]
RALSDHLVAAADREDHRNRHTLVAFYFAGPAGDAWGFLLMAREAIPFLSYLCGWFSVGGS